MASEGETPRSCIITTDRGTQQPLCSASVKISRSLLASAMTLLEHNIDSNARLFPEGTGARPAAMVLDWDDEELPEYTKNVARQRGRIDAIV